MRISKHKNDHYARKEITPLSWGKHLKEKAGGDVQAIGNYFFISENVRLLPLFPYHFRIDVSIAIICTRGKLRGTIGLEPFEIGESSLITLPAGNILKFEEVSDNLEGTFTVLSKELSDDMFSSIKERLELSLFTYANPVILLNREELEVNISYCRLLKNALKDTDNPHLKKVVFHLLLSLYYQQHAHISGFSGDKCLSRQEEAFLMFIQTVKMNYRKERQVGFYAKQLNLTPKYLSTLIKEHTGKTANEWIDEYVILDAKALLRSSTLTIQQISDELNFTEQSSFGKYFKAHEGVSPKEYRTGERAE